MAGLTKAQIKGEIEIPEGVTYLNAASMTPIPKRVQQAGQKGVMFKATPWYRGRAPFYEQVEQARVAMAGLIKASPDDIAITGSTSYGIAVAAANIELPKGTVALTMEGEHGSPVYAWVELARGGGTHEELPRPADGDWTSAILERIEDRKQRPVSVLSLTMVHWTDGAAVDLYRIGEAARAKGIALVVDGTQAVGALPVDVERLKPDFLAFATYKWCFGPYSMGFLYAAPHRQDGRPIEGHNFSRLGADKIADRYGREYAFMPGARRYDMGERSNFVLLPMAIAAAGFLQEVGVASIAAHAKPLNERVAEGARELGFTFPEGRQRAPHIIGLRRKDVDAADAAAKLAAAGIHISPREGAIRVSPNIYNSADDVDAFLGKLREIARRV